MDTYFKSSTDIKKFEDNCQKVIKIQKDIKIMEELNSTFSTSLSEFGRSDTDMQTRISDIQNQHINLKSEIQNSLLSLRNDNQDGLKILDDKNMKITEINEFLLNDISIIKSFTQDNQIDSDTIRNQLKDMNVIIDIIKNENKIFNEKNENEKKLNLDKFLEFNDNFQNKIKFLGDSNDNIMLNTNEKIGKLFLEFENVSKLVDMLKKDHGDDRDNDDNLVNTRITTIESNLNDVQKELKLILTAKKDHFAAKISPSTAKINDADDITEFISNDDESVEHINNKISYSKLSESKLSKNSVDLSESDSDSEDVSTGKKEV
jgi:hypothetical protein